MEAARHRFADQVSDSVFKLAIVRANTHEMVFQAGGPVEIDLVAEIVKAVSRRRVGWFRSQAVVEAEVELAVREVLYAFKATLQP